MVVPAIISDHDGRFHDNTFGKLFKELSCVHDTFYVSNLKKCLVEAGVQVPLDETEIDENLRFIEEPIEIVEWDVKNLKRRRIPSCQSSVGTLGKD
ncbi:hypothetical protein Tco_0514892 [Tanacetum coccineum]